MLPFSKSTLAVFFSSSLLLNTFFVLSDPAVAVADRVTPQRSLNFSSVPPCRCCQSSSKYEYSVVIDAGSSGSRVHVYRWPQSTAGRVESTPGAVEALQPTLKIRQGLATVAGDLTVVRQHIQRLLINASRIIPPELHQFTPVYFMATAGIREMIQPRMSEVISYVDSLMLNPAINPFRYDSVSGSRLLSGEEEAVFDWISVNYLLGNFAADAGDQLVGVVEMGGASVQIGFVPSDDVTEHLFPVQVSNKRYLVYARSNLGYGQSNIVDYIKSQLEADNSTSEVICHPCMLRGDVQTMPNGKTFIGSGDPKSCLDLLRERVICRAKNESRSQLKPWCLLEPIHHAPLPADLQFYAVGAFIYTLPELGALDDDGIFVPAIGYQKAFEFCKLPYDEAMAMVSEAQRQYVTDKCLAALYIPLLLNQGLGFRNGTSVIHVPRTIAGQKPGWSLGAVLYENSQIEYDCTHAAAAADDDDDDKDVYHDEVRTLLSRLLLAAHDNNHKRHF